jgi:hypothetical protein
MKEATALKLPPRETPASLRDIIMVKGALAALLSEEADLMDKMQIAKIGELQDRKLKLTGMLERYMRYMRQHPETLARVSPEEKAELHEVSAVFQRAMRRNYDTLLVARAVNRSVVKCVTQMVTRKEQNPIYNARGIAKAPERPLPVSITLNETV